MFPIGKSCRRANSSSIAERYSGSLIARRRRILDRRLDVKPPNRTEIVSYANGPDFAFDRQLPGLTADFNN